MDLSAFLRKIVIPAKNSEKLNFGNHLLLSPFAVTASLGFVSPNFLSDKRKFELFN